MHSNKVIWSSPDFYCSSLAHVGLNETAIEEYEAKFLNKTITPADRKEELGTPVWVWGLMSLASDLYPAESSGIGHGTHLGGYLFGACFFLVSRLWKAHHNSRRNKWRRFRRRRLGFRKRMAQVFSEAEVFLIKALGQLLVYVEALQELDDLDPVKSPNIKAEQNDERYGASRGSNTTGHRNVEEFVPHDSDRHFYERLMKLMDELEAEMNCTESAKPLAGAGQGYQTW